MAAFEVIALDTATPQLRAPGAADTYTFPRAVEMPLGTANGVLYLNGSKVVTSGSALTFDASRLSFIKASNGRAWSADGDDLFAIENSTSANLDMRTSTTGGSYVMFSDTDARARGYVAYLHGSDSMPFAAAGSEQMRLTSTGLGIGTSSPYTKLEVVGGNISTGGGAGAAQLGLELRGVALNAIPAAQVRGYIGVGNSSIGIAGDLLIAPRTDVGASIRFITGTTPTERMRLDSSGNLGLGVTPSGWGTSGGANVETTSGALMSFSTTQFNVLQNSYYNGASYIYKNTAAASGYQQSAGGHIWYTAPSGTAGNAISFTQAMTLNASGKLGIGETNPGNYTLNVSGVVFARCSFLSYTSDGLFSADALPSVINTPNVGNQIRFGYIDAGGGEYAPRIGFNQVSPASALQSSIGNTAGGAFTINVGSNTERARIPAAGGMVVGTAALATNATDGFLYVPTCAGTPTGTPTTQTGTAPIVVDTTNNKLYFYSNAAWRDAGP